MGQGQRKPVVADPRENVALVAIWLLVASSVAIIPGGLYRFVLGKLLVAMVAVVVATFAPAAGRFTMPARVLLGGGAVVLVVSALLSVSPWVALVGRWPRYEGVVALSVYVGCGWAGARLLGPGASVRRWRAVSDAAATVALLVAAVALLEATGARPLGGAPTQRMGSLMGNATEMGLIGLVTLAVLLPQVVTRRTALHVSGAVAALLVVGLSGSRAAVLGSCLVVLIVAAATWWDARRARARPATRQPVLWAVGGLVLLVALVVAIPATRNRLLYAATVEGRWAMWGETLQLIGDQPLTGVGPSGYVDAIVPYHTEAWALDVGMANPPDSPHNWLLQSLTAGGILLGIVAVAVAVYTLVRGWRAWRNADTAHAPAVVASVAALVGYGVALLTHFTTAGVTPFVALLGGSLLATAVPDAVPQPVRAASGERTAATSGRAGGLLWTIRGAGAIMAAVLALGAVAEWPLAAAYRAYAVGDVAGAQAGFSAARVLRPWDAEIDSQGGQVFAALASSGVAGAADQALTWAARGAQRQPDSIQAGLAYAVALRNTDQGEAALAQLDRLHARSPYEPMVLIQRGQANKDLGNTAAAETDLQMAARYDPGNPLEWRLLAALYQDTGQGDKATDAQAQAEELAHS